MRSIIYYTHTISAPQMGDTFAEQVDDFVEDFDMIINELLGKVCESTGQSQEELLRELEEMDIFDEASDDDEYDTGSH